MQSKILAALLTIVINTNIGQAKMATTVTDPGSGAISFNQNWKPGAVLGATTGSVKGALYYNPDTGGLEQSDGNGSWSPVNTSGFQAVPQPPTFSAQQLATRDQANAGKSTVINSANAAIENTKGTMRNSVLDFIESQKTGQQGIDRSRSVNELNKMRAYGGIEDMIGTGVRSAGTILANKNASSSSATEAIAAAYAKMGQQQAGQANNQYALQNDEIALDQSALDAGRASSMRKFGTDKETFVNTLVSEAETKLSALNEALIGASLPDRIAIEQEKETIRKNALAQLSEFDTMLQQGTQGIAPASREQIVANAGAMDSAGQSVENPFSLSTNTDIAYQNGAPITDLPVFSSNTRRRTQGA